MNLMAAVAEAALLDSSLKFFENYDAEETLDVCTGRLTYGSTLKGLFSTNLDCM